MTSRPGARASESGRGGRGTTRPAPGGQDRAGSSLGARWQREAAGAWVPGLGRARGRPGQEVLVTGVAGHTQGFVAHCQGLALTAAPWGRWQGARGEGGKRVGRCQRDADRHTRPPASRCPVAAWVLREVRAGGGPPHALWGCRRALGGEGASWCLRARSLESERPSCPAPHPPGSSCLGSIPRSVSGRVARPFVHLSSPPGCIHLAASGQRPVVLASEAGGGRQAMEPERRCL